MAIYDNISGDNLATALKKTLEKAKRADFCIGYFNLRGWDLLLESVDALPGGHKGTKKTIKTEDKDTCLVMGE